MMRGEIWTASGGGDFAGKPRPVVVVQSDRFATENPITVCPFTTDPADAPLLRPEVAPSSGNGLRQRCRIMVDKITTTRRVRLGVRIGRLSDADTLRLDRAMLVFLGLAD